MAGTAADGVFVHTPRHCDRAFLFGVGFLRSKDLFLQLLTTCFFFNLPLRVFHHMKQQGAF